MPVLAKRNLQWLIPPYHTRPVSHITMLVSSIKVSIFKNNIKPPWPSLNFVFWGRGCCWHTMCTKYCIDCYTCSWGSTDIFQHVSYMWNGKCSFVPILAPGYLILSLYFNQHTAYSRGYSQSWPWRYVNLFLQWLLLSPWICSSKKSCAICI